ncbi:MAG: DUF2950 domain-containing protein [Nitrospirota bacterium]
MNRLRLYKQAGEHWFPILICVIAVTLFSHGAVPALHAEDIPQRGFSSPEEAVNALIGAVRAEDMEEMLAILGPGSRVLIYSGDDVADRTGRKKFIRAFDRKNTLQKEAEDRMIIYIGEDNWPMPIPIVKTGPSWMFDPEEGKQEILNRRIGRNELHVMEVLGAYVEAQHEYASRDSRGEGVVEFAQQLISSEGERDGLYWEVKEGKEESPLGPLIARASRKGYKDDDISPFYGYYYKILKAQGKHADGGAYDYVVNGKMILGFALIAYPAEYSNSGVMTFMVNQQGVIYEKNIGGDTRSIAEKIEIFDPEDTWTKVEDIIHEEKSAVRQAPVFRPGVPHD